ncbi:MAG: EamA family transporter [Actinomycetota bacterium]
MAARVGPRRPAGGRAGGGVLRRGPDRPSFGGGGLLDHPWRGPAPGGHRPVRACSEHHGAPPAEVRGPSGGAAGPAGGTGPADPRGTGLPPRVPVRLAPGPVVGGARPVGSGLAFIAMATLVGRAGATRGAVAIYFLPVVALTLGVLVRRETVEWISLAGVALVLLGAYVTSRRERAPEPSPEVGA